MEFQVSSLMKISKPSKLDSHCRRQGNSQSALEARNKLIYKCTLFWRALSIWNAHYLLLIIPVGLNYGLYFSRGVSSIDFILVFTLLISLRQCWYYFFRQNILSKLRKNNNFPTFSVSVFLVSFRDKNNTGSNISETRHIFTHTQQIKSWRNDSFCCWGS